MLVMNFHSSFLTEQVSFFKVGSEVVYHKIKSHSDSLCNTEGAFAEENPPAVWVENLVKKFLGGLLESVASRLAGVWLLEIVVPLLGSADWSSIALCIIGLSESQ